MIDVAPLQAWLATHGWADADIEALQGDVSPRRYLRVRRRAAARASTPAILAVYPESVRPSAARFLRTGALLDAAGVRVPRVLAVDLDAGLMLIEESYISSALPEYLGMAEIGGVAHSDMGLPILTNPAGNWWGKGGMIDWLARSNGWSKSI